MTGQHYPKAWGAEPFARDAWRFALWAPDAGEVAVDVEGGTTPMTRDADGWWRVVVPAQAGQSYGFRIDGAFHPDPAARAQAGDVHGPSLLVDPLDFAWSGHWRGIAWRDAVIYELHVGTFTEEGTLAAARRELPRLKALGITMVELMPLAQFEGVRGWGYDGVLLYAPHRAYGGEAELKRFVDAAHGLGLGVLLDVVYNHFGPAGNHLAQWCPGFFHGERTSPWGPGIAYEVPAVRDFFLDNALYWLSEYQLDGLRFDAVHAIEDSSPTHIIDALAQAVRARDWGRHVYLVTEDERNPTAYLEGAARFDGTWNDDWHHAVHCLLTGEKEGYYASFAADPLADIETALRDGYVEQGQPRPHLAHARGRPSAELPVNAFVNFIGNHDQVGNRAQGERLHHLVRDDAAIRVVTALTLLAPFTPMLFMGDEFLTDAPFLFFTDFTGALAERVRTGRAREFERFSAFADDVPDPNALETARRSCIGHAADTRQTEHEAFVRNLLALRADHIAPLLASSDRPQVEVRREGSAFEAAWDFPAGRLMLAFTLGGGGNDFWPPTDPFLVEQRPGSAFALAAAVRRR